MVKKQTFLLVVVALAFIILPLKNIYAFEVIEASGEAILTGPFYDSSIDAYFVDLKDGAVNKAHFVRYTDQTFTTIEEERDQFAADQGGTYFETWQFHCNRAYEVTFYDYADFQIGKVKFIATEIQSPSCGDTTTEPPPTEDGGQTCIGCDLFNCPGWTEFMSGLDSIKAAIPSAPNWEEVATTFTNTITPQVKADMESLLGYAPEPPAAPSAPAAPEMPTLEGGIEAPTGQETPELEDASFDENDIKNEAPVIQEREDPTGGFEINNPVDALPTQEEFMENIPVEGEAPIPGPPTEPENIAPTPPEPENIAPTPTEPENVAPTPSDDTGTAPIPGDTGDSAPIPTEDATAPLPGDMNDTAPIPGG